MAWGLALPPVRWLTPILDDYGAAGGGLLASGVAFNSLFAILPAILLLVSMLGIVLNDPIRLEQIVDGFAERFPPLEQFFNDALRQVSAGAVTFSLLGLDRPRLGLEPVLPVARRRDRPDLQGQPSARSHPARRARGPVGRAC